MDLCILDLASLRYRRNFSHTSLTVYSPMREVLAVLEVSPDLSEKELTFLGSDAVLQKGRITLYCPVRGKVRARVALYNPYTAEVSVNAIPDTEAFSDQEPLSIPETGLLAVLESEKLIKCQERELLLVERTFASLTRAYSTHRA